MNQTQTPIDLKQVTAALLEVLDARSRDIVSRRFGLVSGQRETLESIGREYGITRERVRQIEAHTRKALAALQETVKPVIERYNEVFRTHGGVLAEDHFVAIIQSDAVPIANTEPQFVRFYLNIVPEYMYVAHNELFHPHWRHSEFLHQELETIVTIAKSLLTKAERPVAESDLFGGIQGRLQHPVPNEFIRAALIASRDLEKTPYGDWGRTIWPEVSPRGVGDKAYAVMRRQGEPQHFRTITDLINEAGFDGKRANPQTVHNELIKDSRFVLVGRGLYGLREWGFISGTVADVLEAVLKEAQKPLTREELIDRVMKQRMVKKNTILLGLQNTKRFVKVEPDKYALRAV